MRGIRRWPANSPHKGQWCGALMFSLICAWINDWVNSGLAGDLRRYRTHYDVTVMIIDDYALNKHHEIVIWFHDTLGLTTGCIVNMNMGPGIFRESLIILCQEWHKNKKYLYVFLQNDLIFQWLAFHPHRRHCSSCNVSNLKYVIFYRLKLVQNGRFVNVVWHFDEWKYLISERFIWMCPSWKSPWRRITNGSS